MKKFLLAVILTCGIHTQAQVISTVDCDMMDLSVASQYTDYVNLYHPGHYLTHPQIENTLPVLLQIHKVIVLYKIL